MDNLEKKLWGKCDAYLPMLSWIPFLRMVAVCNNLAFGKVNERSDIDLFIVAKKGRLFLVRSFVTALLQLLGVRRHGDKVAGRFCLSFFIDDSDLGLGRLAIERDIYLAYWIYSMKPAIDDGVFAEFVQHNDWIWSYFDERAILNSSAAEANGFDSLIKSFFETVFAGWFGDQLESILMRWQIKRAKLKTKDLQDSSGIVVAPNILKFHNFDRRRDYREKWENTFGDDLKLNRENFLRIVP